MRVECVAVIEGALLHLQIYSLAFIVRDGDRNSVVIRAAFEGRAGGHHLPVDDDEKSILLSGEQRTVHGHGIVRFLAVIRNAVRAAQEICVGGAAAPPFPRLRLGLDALGSAFGDEADVADSVKHAAVRDVDQRRLVRRVCYARIGARKGGVVVRLRNDMIGYRGQVPVRVRAGIEADVLCTVDGARHVDGVFPCQIDDSGGARGEGGEPVRVGLGVRVEVEFVM